MQYHKSEHHPNIRKKFVIAGISYEINITIFFSVCITNKDSIKIELGSGSLHDTGKQVPVIQCDWIKQISSALKRLLALPCYRPLVPKNPVQTSSTDNGQILGCFVCIRGIKGNPEIDRRRIIEPMEDKVHELPISTPSLILIPSD